jgi:hypothetical protein
MLTMTVMATARNFDVSDKSEVVRIYTHKWIDKLCSYYFAVLVLLRVRFPAGTRNFSLHHRVQNGAGTHPVSCPMGTRGSFSGGKAAGA